MPSRTRLMADHFKREKTPLYVLRVDSGPHQSLGPVVHQVTKISLSNGHPDHLVPRESPSEV